MSGSTAQAARVEFDLLIACTDPAPGRRAARLQAALRGEIDWGSLIGTAIAHGVSPLLAHRLLEAAADDLPDELATALRAHVQDNVQRNQVLLDALFEALDAMRHRGVTALPFKGQTLGALAYDDFALRRAGDLDLFVRRSDVATACACLEELGYREATLPALTRHYRLLGTHFGLRFSSRAQLDNVHPALAQMAIATPPQTHVWLDLAEGADGHVIVNGALPLNAATGLAELAPRVKNLLRQLALDREAFFVELHAGVVSDRTHCMVLPAAPGSGKTTLTAGLVHAGFDYFSDEVALLDEETLRLRPVPLGLGVKPGAVDVLAGRFPELRRLQVHSREDGRQVRYLALHPDQVAPHDAKRDARWLIFPRFAPDAKTTLMPIGRPDALRRLMHECLVLPNVLDEARVGKLVQWMRRLDCYELPMSSLGDAVDCVRRTCGRAP